MTRAAFVFLSACWCCAPAAAGAQQTFAAPELYGSAWEFVRSSILRGLPSFLNGDIISVRYHDAFGL